MSNFKSYYGDLETPADRVIFVVSNIKNFIIMRDFSKPPYDIGEIGREVQSLGERLGITCNLCELKFLKSQGYYSLPTLSEDIVRIAKKIGIEMTVTGDLEQTARQLQSLIEALSAKGIG